MASKKKNRLVIIAGTFTTAIAATLLKQLNDNNTDNYLVSIAPTLYENVDEHILEEAKSLSAFKDVLFYFTFCSPKKQFKDEKKHILSFDINKFKQATNNIEFDEIISVYIHGAAHNLILKYPKAKLYFMEDGTASYLKMENAEALSKQAKKIYTLNYFDKIKPYASLYEGLKTQKIDTKILHSVFEELSSQIDFKLEKHENSVIFCAQNISLNSNAMSKNDELNLYAENILKLLKSGYSVYLKEHPKTPNMFYNLLKQKIHHPNFISLAEYNVYPVELLIPKIQPVAIVSMFSSALFTAPEVFNIPSFTFYKENEFKNHQIFLLAHIIVGCYIPHIDLLFSGQNQKEIFENFLKNKAPIEKQPIYKIKMYDYWKSFISRREFNRTKQQFQKTHKFLLKYAQIPDKVIEIFEKQTYLDFLLFYADNYQTQYKKYSQKTNRNISFKQITEMVINSTKIIAKLIL